MWSPIRIPCCIVGMNVPLVAIAHSHSSRERIYSIAPFLSVRPDGDNRWEEPQARWQFPVNHRNSRTRRKGSPMIPLYINGGEHQVEVSNDKPLLWVRRDDLRMTGTKFACGAAPTRG
jgi:hypothetical protein